MRRVMCVFLPAWPLQRLARARPELRGKPVVLATAHESRPRVLFRSQAAARAGVRPGMPVAEAVALDHAMLVEEEDPAEDVRALERLAAWAERYCPHVGLEEGPAPRGLLLDVTGCGGCFGGEPNLLRLAQREFAEQGWSARLALADSVGAAWGLAHYGKDEGQRTKDEKYGKDKGQRTKDEKSPLSSFVLRSSSLCLLPVAALRLPEETIGLLRSLGIERVGQLEALPRASLPARFGAHVLRRLDQLFGRVPEVIEPHRFLPGVRATCALEFPVERLAELRQLVDRLAEEVHEELRRRHQGARQAECWLYHEMAAPRRLEIGLSRPSQSDRHLAELLKVRLEQTRLEEPVSGLSLRVTVAEPLRAEQPELFDAGQARRQELAALIDRLSSRLGRDAVARAVLVPDPQPEYACRFEAWIQNRVARPERSEGRGVGIPTLAGKKAPPVVARSPDRATSPDRKSHAQRRPSVGSVAGSGDPATARGRAARQSRPHTPCAAAGTRSVPATLHVVQVEPPGSETDCPRPLRLREPAPIDVVAVVPDGPPVRFTWAGVDYVVTRSWGPERIEAGWWRGQDVRRDYYVVATHLGSRFWIFRRRADGCWWLHGSFD